MGDVKIPHSRMTKTCWETLVTCEMYVTSHKRPFVPSVGGIGLLCNVWAEGPVSFLKRWQRSLTG